MNNDAKPSGTSLPAADITVTQAMIDVYATISGDFNPLHVDPIAAAATPFGGTIAHGCIPMEPIFQALRRRLGLLTLPSGTTMSLRYHRPSRPGDTIRIEAVEPAERSEGNTIAFACLNQRGEKVIDGVCGLPRR